MKIMITVGYKALGLECGEYVGSILSALKDAALYESKWVDGQNKWCLAGTKESPEKIIIEIVGDDVFLPSTPLVEQLNKSLKEIQDRWSEAYSRANKAEKELADLKSRVSAFSET